VIGALDMHSARREILAQEDMAALQIVTDQIALAIENALLFSDAQKRLEGRTGQRQSVPEPWDSSSVRVAPFHERVRPGTRSLGDPARSGSMTQLGHVVQKAVAQRSVVSQTKLDGLEQATLVAPIILRGEVIGVLGLHDEENRQQWTSDEIALISAVADQMALALENARLIDETHERAEHERLISGITTRVRGSMDVETILRTAVRELGAALGTDRTFIQLGVGNPSTSPDTDPSHESEE
jgi:GAF domain-containing protein